MIRGMWPLAVLVALTIVGCSVSPDPGMETDPVATNDKAVELEGSFAIPQSQGQLPSHTPALQLSPGGQLLAVTSEGEVVAFDAEGNDLAWRHRIGKSGTDIVSIDTGGRRLAWVPDEGGLAIMDLKDRTILAQDGSLGTSRVALSPDGEQVAVAKGPHLTIRNARTLELEADLGKRSGDISGIAWSPDGKRVASVDLEGGLTAQDVAAGLAVHQSKKESPLHAVAYHPEGRAIAYGGQDNVVWQYVFSTEREEVVAQGQPYWITCLGYSPDGSLLAVGDESCDIWLFRLDTREVTFHSKHHEECWLTEVTWDSSGSTFLFGCRPNQHDDTPVIHEPLIRVEAARADVVKKRRRALIEAIDSELSVTNKKELRTGLKAFKQALARGTVFEAESGPIGTSIISATSAGGANALVGATFALNEPKAGVDHEVGELPELDFLPTGIRTLAQDHQKALVGEMKRLKGSFRIHAWKVRR